MKSRRTVLRKILLAIPNSYVSHSANIANHLLNRNQKLPSLIAKIALINAEVFSLLSLPKRKFLRLIQLNSLCILFYLSTSLFLTTRFGKHFIEPQVAFSLEFEVFENQRDLLLKTRNFEKEIKNRTFEDLNIQDWKYITIMHLIHMPQDFIGYYSEYLESNEKMNFQQIQELGAFTADLLHRKGFFSIAEEVEIISKLACDRKVNRGLGIRNESTYLTAVGHIALFGFFIMAKKTNLIQNYPISIIRDNSKISNELFAKLLLAKSISQGIEIIHHTTESVNESDMELYPSYGQYKIARRMYKSIFMEYEKQYSSSLINFSDIDSSVISVAESVLKRNGISIDAELIGVHCRENQLIHRGNRNSSFAKLASSVQYLEDNGFTIVRLGTAGRVKSRGNIGKRSLDSTKIFMSKTETEALNLYVWSRSKLFLGNLSGGTFPPSLFGVPTIYFDVFPLTHFAPPGKYDKILPKALYSIEKQEILSSARVFDPALSHLQIEDRLKLMSFGYLLKDTTSDEILETIRQFMSKGIKESLA